MFTKTCKDSMPFRILTSIKSIMKIKNKRLSIPTGLGKSEWSEKIPFKKPRFKKPRQNRAMVKTRAIVGLMYCVDMPLFYLHCDIGCMEMKIFWFLT